MSEITRSRCIEKCRNCVFGDNKMSVHHQDKYVTITGYPETKSGVINGKFVYFLAIFSRIYEMNSRVNKKSWLLIYLYTIIKKSRSLRLHLMDCSGFESGMRNFSCNLLIFLSTILNLRQSYLSFWKN